MKKLYEPNSSVLTVRYSPDGERCAENPPRFSWMPANEDNCGYVLQISSDENFTAENTRSYTDIPYNFFAPDVCLESGDYFWRYGMQTDQEVLYSQVRSFSVDEQSVKTPLKSHEQRFAHADGSHPRLWMSQAQIADFRKQLAQNKQHCQFDAFYKNCVEPRLGKSIIAEPKPYPDNKRVIALWRQNYMDCQEAYNHIRSFAVAGVILKDQNILSQAVDALMQVAQWDPNGATARDYNDECAFRVVEALAWGYDWLYHSLDDAQRNTVRAVLLQRTKQVAMHAMVYSKIHYSLFDSHAVRSLSSALTPACIAMLGEEDQVIQWLNYTIDYLNVLYTPWGGADGGWAEGGLYWTTGMAYLIGALNLIKNFTGIDTFRRPFFQKTGSFPLYCFPHDTYRASYCDQSNLGEKPILKTGFNAREFAGITRNGEYQWYFEQIAKRESYNDTRFFNLGWWDFYFDEMLYCYNYQPVAPQAPQAGRQVKWFRDIGWVAVHQNMQDEQEHVFFLTKSSPYGSVSHSHADQNSFLLFAYGEPLLIESGYYIGFNSSMHRDWRKQTRSKNTLLIDGLGQYAGMDKTMQLAATGTVLDVTEQPNCVQIREDATAAYKLNIPYLEQYTREIYYVDDCYFIVVDYVELHQPAEVSFLLHSLFEPSFKQNRLQLQGEKAALSCEFIYVSAGTEQVDINNTFTGVNPEEIKGLETSWNFALKTKQSKKHTIVSCIHPHKVDDNHTIRVIKDDQGHDIYFYFQNDGKPFTICVDGNKRY